MELLGIQFAPLNIPLSRRLQTISVATWYLLFIFGPLIGIFLEIYLLFFTNYWWLAALYLLWIYYDQDTCENGGRPIEAIRNWSWWDNFRDYFPLNLTTANQELQLDPKRNYLFCSFPHGLLSLGALHAFGSTRNNFVQLFPNHRPVIVTITKNLQIPFYREFLASFGGISATFQSICNVLQRPQGGNIVVVMPGGAAEAYCSRPRQYKILLKKRKGFIRVALKTGASLVPVVSFGEVDIFDQVDGPKLKKVQEFVRKLTGMAPVVPLGRGFFQYSFGILPHRRPITTVVGDPIDVQRIEQPTNEQIDALHGKFTEALVELFEQHKHRYIENAKDVHLEL